MKEVEGKYAAAKIFTDDVEDYAIAQIRQLCDQPAFEGSKIRVMPDVHPGKVGTIGFTATVKDKIMPNVIGVDIGCGMFMQQFRAKGVELQRLDTVIRECVPSGHSSRAEAHWFADRIDLGMLRCAKHIDIDRAYRSLGTLGGGNHFIEIDTDERKQNYLIIHTGSRHLGKEVIDHYLREGHRRIKDTDKDAAFELTWLEDDLKADYLYDMIIVQKFAEINRRAIAYEITKGMKWKVMEEFSCIHNYIDFSYDTPIMRKGAISARKDEDVIIPINMRDGVLVGKGIGNADWNYSAPHGAGRLASREETKRNYTLSDFKKEMKGIYSPSISKDTLDEAPFAYRPLDQILPYITDTVEITKRLKPIYNFKA